MAKVVSPLLSLDASGTFGDTLVYAKWKGIKYVRKWVIPQNPKTALQVAQRDLFSSAVDGWHGQTDRQDAFDAAVAGLPLSGFNYYVKLYIEQYDFPVIPGE